jgi:predicted ATP-dependent protease
MTGSVNQFGQIQAVGGVTRKVEGFFEVCRARGLNGEQGVIIPSTNVRHLMLKTEVVEAVEQGQFHVWSVDTIDEAIEILTGIPAGVPDANGTYPADTVHGRVSQRIAADATRFQRFSLDHRGDGATSMPLSSSPN